MIANSHQVVKSGQISALHEEVLESLKEHEILSNNINLEFEQELTVWERMSDKVAFFGGSWRFIVGFAQSLTPGWSLPSPSVAARRPLPLHPLNLILSCLATIQAPVIMMSQNRQGAGPLAFGARLPAQP
jgi:uncharacterized membrane protein